MNDITTRFLDVYRYLYENKIVLNPKSFAKEINISTSLITEICKLRTNAGITPIQNLLQKYTDIDANWLLTGEGSMLKNNRVEININYKELAEARLEIIEMKNEKIKSLNKEVAALKDAKR
ncbi:hypothetical protein [Flavobacterium sp. UBA7680]|uniref:hypothetical protein n=1 Tax=Flavobacterium sp. UBA7680 TaxID=1946559 RepID=UPI0025BE1548|nr:hypothetical protein [Flavobacterium sp. UBA7680]